MSSSDEAHPIHPDLEMFVVVRAHSMGALTASPQKWTDGQVAIVTSLNKLVAYSAATGEWHLAKGGN